MKQYVITFLLKPTDTPLFKRTELPLHLTLGGPFFSDAEFSLLGERIRRACRDTRAMTVKGLGRRMFGRDRNIPGTIIERTEELHAFHNRLFDELKGLVTIKIPEHNRTSYTPHVSDRPDGKVLPGQTFTIDSASLLEFEHDTMIVLFTEPIL